MFVFDPVATTHVSASTDGIVIVDPVFVVTVMSWIGCWVVGIFR